MSSTASVPVQAQSYRLVRHVRYDDNGRRRARHGVRCTACGPTRYDDGSRQSEREWQRNHDYWHAQFAEDVSCRTE